MAEKLSIARLNQNQLSMPGMLIKKLECRIKFSCLHLPNHILTCFDQSILAEVIYHLCNQTEKYIWNAVARSQMQGIDNSIYDLTENLWNSSAFFPSLSLLLLYCFPINSIYLQKYLFIIQGIWDTNNFQLIPSKALAAPVILTSRLPRT